MAALSTSTHAIDPYLFEKHLDAFVQFVERKSGMHFESFPSNPYTRPEEGYKLEASMAGNEALNCVSWEPSTVGTGQILKAVIGAIEIPVNNLVQWDTRYGEKSRPHQPFYIALGDEREALVKARIGQGRFRDALIDHWGSCAVTEVADQDLLRASHIIPWSEASRTGPTCSTDCCSLSTWTHCSRWA